CVAETQARIANRMCLAWCKFFPIASSIIHPLVLGGWLIFRAAGSSRRQQQSQQHVQDSDWTHLGIAIRLVVDIRAWPAIAKFVSDPKVGEKLTLVEAATA
ncbi:4765_t:CDS:2, partial [Scutellospora calospora]